MSKDYRGHSDTDADFEAKASRAAHFMLLQKKMDLEEELARRDCEELIVQERRWKVKL